MGEHTLGPICGPYPNEAQQAARHYLVSLGYDRGGGNTSDSAAATNSPLWQSAISRHLSRAELRAAEARGQALIALAGTVKGRAQISLLGARATWATASGLSASKAGDGE